MYSMPMMLVSDPILSPQDNKCNSIYSSLFINDGGGRCYIYIYIYIQICILAQFVCHTTHNIAFCQETTIVDRYVDNDDDDAVRCQSIC